MGEYDSQINYPYIKRHKHFYKKLACATRVQRKLYIKSASEDELHSLRQCACWILTGKIRITQRQETRLRENKHTLRELSLGKNSKSIQRLLLDDGYFLPFLANAIVNKFFKKNIQSKPGNTKNS
jgi:hypothetical protein